METHTIPLPNRQASSACLLHELDLAAERLELLSAIRLAEAREFDRAKNIADATHCRLDRAIFKLAIECLHERMVRVTVNSIWPGIDPMTALAWHPLASPEFRTGCAVLIDESRRRKNPDAAALRFACMVLSLERQSRELAAAAKEAA